MYALLRTDLNMNSGKAASQAGHAFLDSFVSAPPILQDQYRRAGGTKIVLAADGLDDLHKAYVQALDAGIPASLIIESGHVMLPVFTGADIVTAVGIGPCSREQAKPILRKFKLYGRAADRPSAQAEGERFEASRAHHSGEAQRSSAC